MRRVTTPLHYILFFILFLFFTAASAQDDAGISAITQPSGSVCRGTANVEATLHNYGAANISTVTVEWSVNGILQAPVNYAGTLTPGGDTTLVLGSYAFNAGNYSLVAYSENPNGGGDADNSNDTSSASVTTQMSGTYTIGGATPDYVDFTTAVNDLNNLGVCGVVTFNVRPGTYTEKLLINQITGSSSTNTITFQSENGDSSTVILDIPSVDSTLANNYLIRLNGTDYLTLKQMTLSRSGISANARILDYTSMAAFNTITNCHLLGVNNGITANSLGALVYSSGGTPFNDSMNTFANNLFENGSIGIYFNGVSLGSLENGTVISNNQFVNQFTAAMQMAYEQAAAITGNFITSNSNSSGYYGIYLSACYRATMVSKNKLESVPGNGFYFIDCGAFPNDRGMVSNNFVNTTALSGITLLNGGNLDIAHNSVHAQSTNTSESALALRGGIFGIIIKNNALVNSGGGYAYLIADTANTGLAGSNYNNLFSSGTNVGSYLGANTATLIDWQTATARDTNSVSVDPAFASASDLHATSLSMDNLGTPISNILVDIDNDPRSATTPDIGADEYSGLGHDVGVTSMLSPLDQDCEDSAAVVSVVVHNYGQFTETNVPVQVDVTGAFTATLNTTISSLAAGADTTVTFVTTVNTSGGGDATFTAYTAIGVDDVHANDTVTSLIHINAIPAAPVATGDTICGPGNVILTATSADTLYWYDVPTGGIELGTGSPFITPLITGTTTFYVEARNICTSTRVAVDAVILPLPNINLGNDTSILLGSSITLDAGAGFTSYLWSTGETTQTINLTPTLPDCYTATVSGANGCVTTDTICVNVVFPADVGVQSLVTPTDHQCESATTPITIVVANYGSSTATDIPVQIDITGGINVTFMDTLFGSIPAAGTVPFTIDSTINTIGVGQITITAYTLSATDQYNLNDTLITVLNFNPVPAAPIVSDTSLCGPGSVTLTGSASDTIYWFDAAVGGNIMGIGDLNILVTGTTTFYAQTGFSCPSTTRDTVTVTVLPLPPVSLGPDTTIECGSSLALDAGAGYVNYLWSTTEATQSIIVDTLGDYSVTVTDTSGCINSDTVHVDCIVGVNAIVALNNVHVYPNPTGGLINIEFANQMQTVTVRWMDLQGQVVQEENLQGVMQKQYDLSSVPKGIYILQVLSDEGNSLHRVIVQ